MGEKDIITKEILKRIARDIATYILKMEIKEDIELIDKEFTRVEKRDADLLFRNGEEIVHLEIQNQNHPKMHLRMLRYLSDILFEYEKHTIQQYLLYMGEQPCRMKNRVPLPNQSVYTYHLIDMRDIPCQSLLESDDPSAIVLSILCDFEGRDKQEVVNTILMRLRQLCDDREYANHLRMVSTLSTNRNLEKEFKKGVEMLTIDIEKTPLYQIGVEKGELKGKKYATLENVAIMIERYKIPLDNIVKDFGLKKEELVAYLKQRNQQEDTSAK